MQIDLRTMSTEQLEKLIADAMLEHTRRESGDVSQPEPAKYATVNPAWRGDIVDGRHLLLSLRHTGAGVVSFMLGRTTFAALYGYFSQVAALGVLTDELPPDVAASTAPSSSKLN